MCTFKTQDGDYPVRDLDILGYLFCTHNQRGVTVISTTHYGIHFQQMKDYRPSCQLFLYQGTLVAFSCPLSLRIFETLRN